MRQVFYITVVLCMHMLPSFGQEGCEVTGVVLTEARGSIEQVLVYSYDSSEYETTHKLEKLDEIRDGWLKSELGIYSSGISSAKGEFKFLMGSSKYAIFYHPNYKLKIIERSKLRSLCDFGFVELESKSNNK